MTEPQTTARSAAYFHVKPIARKDMEAMKKEAIEKAGFVVRGYPAYVCEETGELYPLPERCSLYVTAE